MQINTNTDQGYKLTTIATKKFKTTVVKVAFKAPLDRNTITSRILLANILRNSTQSYPTKKELNAHLEHLYGAHLSAVVNKQGQSHTIKFYLSIANEKFLQGASGLLESGVNALNEMIFNPLIKENAFDQDVIELEKRLLKEEIESIYDDKTTYATKKLIAHMCKDEKYGVNSEGYIEDLANISATSVYDTYQSMLNNDAVTLSIVGDISHEEVSALFAKNFDIVKKHAQLKIDTIDNEDKTIKNIETITETQNIAQAKLNIGYRTHTRINDEDYFALMVFNGVFGAFAHSKLFTNVREKNSLCYYCSSRLDNFKGLMYVYSGLDFKNCDMAQKIIDEQLTDVANGNITEKEIELAKKSLINSKLESLDSSLGMVAEQEVSEILGYELSTETYLEKINAVTKDDIQKIAKKMTKDTIFILTKEGAE